MIAYHFLTLIGIFQKLDDGTPGELNGAWLMSGRYRNGVKQTRSTDRPRKL